MRVLRLRACKRQAKKKKKLSTPVRKYKHTHPVIMIYPIYLKLWHVYAVYMFYICMKKLEGEILFESINLLEVNRVYNKANCSVICGTMLCYLKANE